MPDLGVVGRGGARRRTRRRVKRRTSVAVASQPVPAEPAPQQQNTAPAEDNSVEQLEKLAELKEKGVITEEEFQAKKKQLLGI